jgi:hypothetical protein
MVASSACVCHHGRGAGWRPARLSYIVVYKVLGDVISSSGGAVHGSVFSTLALTRCRTEWVRGICEKPRIKCAEC